MYGYLKNRFNQTSQKCGAVFEVVVLGMEGCEESKNIFVVYISIKQEHQIHLKLI